MGFRVSPRQQWLPRQGLLSNSLHIKEKVNDLKEEAILVYGFFIWWMGVDSNHRKLSWQIYSLLPLATREPIHVELVKGLEPATC